MARMYDYLMRDKGLDGVLRDGLGMCQVIDMNNVVSYLMETDRQITLHDLPNMAPPFDMFFLDVNGSAAGKFFGPIAEAGGFFFWTCHDEACIQRNQDRCGAEVRWCLHTAMMFRCNDCNDTHIPDMTWTVNVAPDGAMATSDIYTEGCPWANYPNWYGDEQDSIKSAILPPLFAINFMHCRNVQMVEQTPPEKLSRKAERKYGAPLSRYHTLKVQAIGSRSNGSGAGKHLSPGMHIARGHFKTFSDDAPLFGKWVGTYWWESQVRGNAQHGTVAKDYEIGEVEK